MDTLDHAANATCAIFTAASRSDDVAKRTNFVATPRAGSKTSAKRSDSPTNSCPPTWWLMMGLVMAASFFGLILAVDNIDSTGNGISGSA
jgi:hypothetical protein